MNSKLELTLKVIVSTILVLLFTFLIIGIPFLASAQNMRQVECLKPIAEDYCNEMGLVSVNVGVEKFSCTKNIRLVSGYIYKFLSEEKAMCYTNIFTLGENHDE